MLSVVSSILRGEIKNYLIRQQHRTVCFSINLSYRPSGIRIWRLASCHCWGCYYKQLIASKSENQKIACIEISCVVVKWTLKTYPIQWLPMSREWCNFLPTGSWFRVIRDFQVLWKIPTQWNYLNSHSRKLMNIRGFAIFREFVNLEF